MPPWRRSPPTGPIEDLAIFRPAWVCYEIALLGWPPTTVGGEPTHEATVTMSPFWTWRRPSPKGDHGSTKRHTLSALMAPPPSPEFGGATRLPLPPNSMLHQLGTTPPTAVRYPPTAVRYLPTAAGYSIMRPNNEPTTGRAQFCFSIRKRPGLDHANSWYLIAPLPLKGPTHSGPRCNCKEGKATPPEAGPGRSGFGRTRAQTRSK